MSRKHFERLAWELRQSYPEPGDTEATDLASDWYAGRVRQWETDVRAVMAACEAFNPGFLNVRFETAAGLRRRPDGAMYPTTAPR